MRAKIGIWVGIIGVAACAGTTVKPAPLGDEGRVVQAGGTAPADAPPLPLPSPEELYATCEARVEGPSVEGECASDADCGTAGCAAEVCTTRTAAADVTTTCENKLCFSILDTCGCVDGQCSWSIKDAVPPEALPVRPPIDGKPALGSSLPSGPPVAPDPEPAPEAE